MSWEVGSKDTGGQAFPFSYGERDLTVNGHNDVVVKFDHGMTLRDYFAAKALQGYLSAGDAKSVGTTMLADWAYQQADAMLAERRK